MKRISLDVLLNSELISNEESYSLIAKFALQPLLTADEILELDLPAKNRVEALLQPEFLGESKLRELACDFAAHTLYVFEAHAPNDDRPRECIATARILNSWGIGSWESLQQMIKEALPAMKRFQGTEYVGAFEACHAALLLDSKDAAWMAREVAVRAQIAAHRSVWESRTSSLEPGITRELEAVWQLARIVGNLPKQDKRVI